MRKISELEVHDLRKVFENNRELENMVFDDMYETADFYTEEYLGCWKRSSIDYCIGWDRGTYFKCEDRNGFIDGLRHAQRMFCFLADEWNETIDYVEELICKLDYLYYNSSSDNYDMVDSRINELIEELEEACYNRFMMEYEACFDYENKLDYFINFYAMERMDDSYYIDDNYNLFQHIEYTKKFN